MVECNKREGKVKYSKYNFFKFFAMLAMILSAGVSGAVGPQNSRAATNSNVAPARAAGRDVKRMGNVATGAGVSRSAVQRPNVGTARGASDVSLRGSARSAVSVSGTARPNMTVARSAASNSVARSAIRAAVPAVGGRSLTSPSRAAASRAASSRATAVFNDVSKIGGGYAQCREAYATCMDQFCAKANETYRRCFCSERFTSFRDTEDALDQAKVLLQQFEDNNLNAVDKTAAEVNAMYSATVGEAAIKNDTSGAASLLAEIGDLISGKKKTENKKTSMSLSLDSLNLDFSTDIGDIWGGSSSAGGSIFGGDGGVDFATLEGEELFNQVHKQCVAMVSESCTSSAVANMAKSAYGIMIAQDCNAYEKSVDTKREQVQATVRQAERILREARLEEYRSHNSADVNECLDTVRSAMLADTACGKNYKRCLDYTGAYINQSTGEPVYSQRLFELQNLILLSGVGGDMDILGQNKKFDEFLESRKMFATAALDSCRDISSVVWEEFKRTALIEIAQAQDEKIEEIKATCVETMRDCYDTQSNSLKSFDDETAGMVGAISMQAAREMCQDKVIACASLYGDTDGCQFDGNGKLLSSSNTANSKGRCGLDALLAYVDTIDTVRIAAGCEEALRSFVTDLCTPTTGEHGYPWNCRQLTDDQIASQISQRAQLYCVDIDGNKFGAENPVKTKDAVDTLAYSGDQTAMVIKELMTDLEAEISTQLQEQCVAHMGIWSEQTDVYTVSACEDDFYQSVFGLGDCSKGDSRAHGVCLINNVQNNCLKQNAMTGGLGYARYDAATDSCIFEDGWYEYYCANMLHGEWLADTGMCLWDGQVE